MDLHAPVPPSSDGGYDLSDMANSKMEFAVDPEATPTDEVGNGPAVEAALSKAEAAAEAQTMVADITGEHDRFAAAPTEVNGQAPESPESPEPPTKPAEAGPKLRRKKRVVKKRWDAPAWVVSALIHFGILGGLAAVATTSGDVVKRLVNLDTSLVTNPGAAEELTKIYADPAEVRSDQAVGNPDSSVVGSGMGFSSNAGAAPSATPVVSRTGRPVNEKTSLPTIPTISMPSALATTSVRLNRDLGGGGMVGGDVSFEAGDVGVALDQIAREILRHLTQHKVTVVWLFDESESMKDDQKEIRKKFDRVVNELKINTPDDIAAPKSKKKSTSPPLNHAIIGFGDDVHFNLEKPTTDIEQIGRAIDKLQIDSSGKENTMTAVAKVISHYGNLISEERKLLIVLVTDESGDDGDFVEEARQLAVNRDVPIYVIGRQSLLGTGHLRIEYHDPVTKDIFWVAIRRGPETADVEALQYDGLHVRWDEVPSGFGPYELARLAKDSGGIYFLLPSEEGLRVRKREKAYSIQTLKEYIPDYESRAAYLERRQKSEFRRTLYDIIQETNKYPLRHHFPVFPDQLIPAIDEAVPRVTLQLNSLIEIEKRLRQIEKLRNREPEKRWQAAYDLMLAQVVAYQIKAYEYRANLQEMYKNPPKPSVMPNPELFVDWTLDHSHERKAPKENTEKPYAEATRLFNLVVERHPNTPWADLALDEIRRGFSVKRNEWHHKHSTRYEERAKLVPKF
jgi:von Willebrand factor type A domain